MAEIAQPQTAAARFSQLALSREPFLQTGREMAALTLPGLLPPAGLAPGGRLPEPYQSVGARGVNNLAAQLLLVLFPPKQKFFRLLLSAKALVELEKRVVDREQLAALRGQFEDAFGRIERLVVERMESGGSRAVRFEAFKHLIVAGNCLLYVGKDGREKLFALDKYVVKRDLSGTVLEIVVQEQVARMALPPAAREIANRQHAAPSDPHADENNLYLYTWVRRSPGGAWTVHQELLDTLVPGSEGTYPKDRSAWLALRWTALPGEDYGRGYCEEYSGDLRTLEGFRASIIEWGAAAAKLIGLVRPGGETSVKALNEANSGDYIEGNAADISYAAVEKAVDFQVLAKVAADAKQNLEQAFLLASAVQRDAERVTAEEIRTMIQALEQMLGGVYSVQAQEFQRPVVLRHMQSMMASGELPPLPKDAVAFEVITGEEGLGRATDLQRLDAYLAGVEQLFGPDAMTQYVNVGEYLKRRAVALGVESEGLIRSEQQVQAMRQAQAAQDMTKTVAPSLVGAATKGAEIASNQQQSQPVP